MFFTASTAAADLIPHMGDEATISDANFMRRILIDEGFQNMELSGIPEEKWLEMLGTACRFAEENPEV